MAVQAQQDSQSVAGAMQSDIPPPKQSASFPTATFLVSQELQLRIERAINTRNPLLERLAVHWFNHFTVSASSGFVGMFVGSYDREAIRPHLLGRFETMLNAAVLHPAMLFYLGNRNSVGQPRASGKAMASGD